MLGLKLNHVSKRGSGFVVVSSAIPYHSREPSSWWHHLMETFSALLALCEGKPPVTGWFPSQRPVMRCFDVFFDLCLNWTHGWANNWDAGDLRCYCTHYDVSAMCINIVWPYKTQQSMNYCKISNIRCTKSQNFNVSRLGLPLSLRNIL